jgi:hypothetical protein
MAKTKKKKNKKPPRQKKKLTAEQRRAKRERKKKFMTIFINGKQKRVKRPPTVEGVPVDEFIANNADPIWLHQMGMWEYITPEMFGDPTGITDEGGSAEPSTESVPF